jgi:hypothetical protein
LLAGQVKVPKIYCLKELQNKENGMRIIPIALKNGATFQVQKFRIPFKIMTSGEYDIEFYFMKTCAAFNSINQ